MARDVAGLDGGAARAASITVTNICTNERTSRGSDGLSANIQHPVTVDHQVKELAEHDASGVRTNRRRASASRFRAAQMLG